MKNDQLVDIILPLAIAGVFTYRIDQGTIMPMPGVRVMVPLGKKSITGIVYRCHTGELPQHVTIKSVLQVLDNTPIVSEKQIRLWEWLSDYYMCTLGEVLSAALPAGIIDDDYTALTMQMVRLHSRLQDASAMGSLLEGLKRAKAQEKLLRCFLSMAGEGGVVERRELLERSGVSSSVLRTMIDKQIFDENQRVISRLRRYAGTKQLPNPLDWQQQSALNAIGESWKTKDVCLLHGVTSSGKTEVYIHLIQQALQAGKQVLYLVPEIALTTQLTERLQAVFGDQLIVYHSRFSSAERVEIYREVRGERLEVRGERLEVRGERGEVRGKVILGARSAIFLPFSDLGLIIVDEEHEPSYKQQDPAPRYHARSAAIMMAGWYGAKVLLGTATPSLDSYHNALLGKYGLVEMKERFRGLRLPHITMVDLQRQYHRKEMYGHFADPVVYRIREEIEKGKQVILFQNRRGYSPYLQCVNCGEVPKCPNCDVSMTYHKSNATLVCHCCGYATQAPRQCPKCGKEYRAQGFGTERLEEEIQQLFPAARVARMDLDTTRKKDGHQRIIDQFAHHEVDILIGTQMVTKGLHFDDVSLVVVLQADSILNQPNFRSYEHGFQMLEQVSGRAGRTGTQGEVMIQTFDPKGPIFDFLQRHDYLSLYHQQIAERQLFGFPPFHRMILLTMKHRDLVRVTSTSQQLQEQLRAVFGKRISGVILPSVARLQNMHVRQIRITIEVGANVARAKQLLHEQISAVLQQPHCKGTIVYADVDPM